MRLLCVQILAADIAAIYDCLFGRPNLVYLLLSILKRYACTHTHVAQKACTQMFIHTHTHTCPKDMHTHTHTHTHMLCAHAWLSPVSSCDIILFDSGQHFFLRTKYFFMSFSTVFVRERFFTCYVLYFPGYSLHI